MGERYDALTNVREGMTAIKAATDVRLSQRRPDGYNWTISGRKCPDTEPLVVSSDQTVRPRVG